MSLRRVITAATMAGLLVSACASNGGETATGASDPTGSTAPAGSAGQGGQAGDAQAGGTTSAPATTAPPTPSTVATAPSTVKPAPTTAAPAPTVVLDPNLLPEESNCSPGPGALPDGLWFGYAVEGMDDVLNFDLACWFTGEPAVRAAAEDGGESPPPNDYWIRNANLTERSVVISSLDLPVLWLYDLGSPDTEVITYNEWLIERGTGYQPAVWITVENGQLTSMVEQYLP